MWQNTKCETEGLIFMQSGGCRGIKHQNTAKQRKEVGNKVEKKLGNLYHVRALSTCEETTVTKGG